MKYINHHGKTVFVRNIYFDNSVINCVNKASPEKVCMNVHVFECL